MAAWTADIKHLWGEDGRGGEVAGELHVSIEGHVVIHYPEGVTKVT